ncbi:MAG: ThuA domain-containing protein [Limisphaerales bacterium]
MKSLLFALLCAATSALCAEVSTLSSPKPKVLVITGGHGFERKPFLEMFSQNPNLSGFTHVAHSKDTSDAYDKSYLYDFDVVVLYDMVQNITEEQKKRFRALFERGIGLVVLHHAIVSYRNWPEFERIIGGTYPEPQDKKGHVTDQLGYEHDVDIPVKILKTEHPVTAGLSDFLLNDEIYWGYRTTKDVTPLVTTTHPKSGKPLAWTRSESKSRIVYIQLGHGPTAFKDANYQKLLSQAIQWTAKRN